MRSRLSAQSFRHRIALMVAFAALAAAPALSQDEEDESADSAHEETTEGGESEDHHPVGDEPAHEEPSADEESSGTYSYHGMVIEGDEVVSEASPEMLEEFFGGEHGAGEEGEEGEEGVESRAPGSLTATPYAKECMKEGVPIPPSFKASGWKRIGRLPKGRIFASTKKPRAEVMVYTSIDSGKPTGVCVALPRGEEDGSVELMGVICQSKKTGKACFWDNWDRTASTPTQMSSASYQEMEIERFQDGSMLKENCTDCHRGDNVYVIHEDTLLAKSPLDDVRKPDVRYQPIGQAGWVNPAHANPPGGCTDCHGLPEFSPKYCTTVLMKSLGTTMPPKRKATWKKDHKSDIEQICMDCGETTGICATP